MPAGGERMTVDKRTDADLQAAQGTAGIQRRVAFEDHDHWFGQATAEPNTLSGWHHHGDNVTLGFVLSGEIVLESGPGGQDRCVVGAGEWFRVPKHAIHREGNAADLPSEVVIVRIGDGPVVFPADGPEPS